jgi:3-hydroxyacyl-CoA dehydrogenase
MNSMKKYSSLGVVAGVIAGGAMGFGLSATGVSSATTVPPITQEIPSDSHPLERGAQMRALAAERLAERLQPLVDDGTLSQDQLDAVISQLQKERPMRTRQMIMRSQAR